MSHSERRWPLDQAQHLRDALRETGLPDSEFEELMDTFADLAAWRAPAPTDAETRDLIARLRPYVPELSAVRRALRSRRPSIWFELHQLVWLVRSQISVLQPSFWLVTALVTLLGALALLAGLDLSQGVVLQLVGPILSYLGTVSAFRGSQLHVLEFELACPPSPRQLALARLSIVLTYDVALGAVLTAVSSSQSGAAMAVLTLHWLAPLLLGVGLTLVLSLRLRIDQAAAIAYVAWLAVPAGEMIGQDGVTAPFAAVSPTAEAVLSSVGIVLVAGAVLALPKALPRALPRS